MHRRKTENTERKRPGVRIETSTLPKPQFITGDLFFFASLREKISREDAKSSAIYAPDLEPDKVIQSFRGGSSRVISSAVRSR